MSDADNKGKDNVKMYDNQHYDMEVDLGGDDDKDDSQEGKLEKVQQFNRPENDDEEANYQDVNYAPQQQKALPKFDISKFQELQTSPEIKDLLTIMQR